MTQQSTTQQNKIKPAACIDILVYAAWNLAYTALWNHCILSSAEKDKARAAIRQHLQQSGDTEKAYSNFCQRVLLAEEYISRDHQRYIPFPSYWLDSNNDSGFEGTQAWMNSLLKKRSALPLHRREWKALAEAVLEMAADPLEKNFWYWKIYFLERREHVLWGMFLCTVANMQYKQ